MTTKEAKMSDEVLRECPFCPDGGQPYFDYDGKGERYYCEAGCEDCGVHFHLIGTEEEVIKLWNTRRTPAPVSSNTEVDLEQLKRAIGFAESDFKKGNAPDYVSQKIIIDASRAFLASQQVQND